MCNFVSGPQTCLESLFVSDRSLCATAIDEACPSNGVPQPVRVRYQFNNPGVYYAVCTKNDPGEPVGTHCLTGMHAQITVTGQDTEHDGTATVVQLQLQSGNWGIARYHDLTVAQGDKVQFVIDQHEHDLQHIVVPPSWLSDESNDCLFPVVTTGPDATPLVSQTDSVQDSSSLTYTWTASTPGVHLFWCSQGPVFHCTFGMHFRVNVTGTQGHNGKAG